MQIKGLAIVATLEKGMVVGPDSKEPQPSRRPDPRPEVPKSLGHSISGSRKPRRAKALVNSAGMMSNHAF